MYVHGDGFFFVYFGDLIPQFFLLSLSLSLPFLLPFLVHFICWAILSVLIWY